jgi:hypothetical protein
MLDLVLRKIVVNMEDVLIEGGRQVPRLNRIVVAAGVLKNPWADAPFVQDLKPAIDDIAPELAKVLVPRLVETIGGAGNIEAYGKTAVVGTMGEIEHGAALIHTLRFANLLRQAIAGTAFMPFTNKRGAPGCTIDIPLKHIAQDGARSHFLTASFAIADAPAPDEVIIAIAASTSGRPHHRIGDRYEDMKAMGVDQTGQTLKEPA